MLKSRLNLTQQVINLTQSVRSLSVSFELDRQDQDSKAYRGVKRVACPLSFSPRDSSYEMHTNKMELKTHPAHPHLIEIVFELNPTTDRLSMCFS